MESNSSEDDIIPNGIPAKKTKGRVKIKMEFIDNKLRRYTTFSKRKTGIMKKAYELSTLTGTQVMLLVASETGHVYTFATRKLQPMITSESGKALIQTCLNSPDNPPPLTFTHTVSSNSNVLIENDIPLLHTIGPNHGNNMFTNNSNDDLHIKIDENNDRESKIEREMVELEKNNENNNNNVLTSRIPSTTMDTQLYIAHLNHISTNNVPTTTTNNNNIIYPRFRNLNQNDIGMNQNDKMLLGGKEEENNDPRMCEEGYEETELHYYADEADYSGPLYLADDINDEFEQEEDEEEEDEADDMYGDYEEDMGIHLKGLNDVDGVISRRYFSINHPKTGYIKNSDNSNISLSMNSNSGNNITKSPKRFKNTDYHPNNFIQTIKNQRNKVNDTFYNEDLRQAKFFGRGNLQQVQQSQINKNHKRIKISRSIIPNRFLTNSDDKSKLKFKNSHDQNLFAREHLLDSRESLLSDLGISFNSNTNDSHLNLNNITPFDARMEDALSGAIKGSNNHKYNSDSTTLNNRLDISHNNYRREALNNNHDESTNKTRLNNQRKDSNINIHLKRNDSSLNQRSLITSNNNYPTRNPNNGFNLRADEKDLVDKYEIMPLKTVKNGFNASPFRNSAPLNHSSPPQAIHKEYISKNNCHNFSHEKASIFISSHNNSSILKASLVSDSDAGQQTTKHKIAVTALGKS
ncbi:probable serine/threonine-protein kinase clkA isoform X2 [Gordionus sp. m RMFG-2023]|uniref:probable serine/threonine-protein kinase clkA isoform X2 n=1 Tax=Gordionus sp. m RMFG-2023 TaxID=3053472 RepID=UPI0031FD9EC8